MCKVSQDADQPQRDKPVVERKAKRSAKADREPTEINWQTWWPFTRLDPKCFPKPTTKRESNTISILDMEDAPI